MKPERRAIRLAMSGADPEGSLVERLSLDPPAYRSGRFGRSR